MHISQKIQKYYITGTKIGYPRNASFAFNGFHGTKECDIITKALKSSAFDTGSKIRHSTRKEKSTTRRMPIDFFYERGKYFSECKHKFN